MTIKGSIIDIVERVYGSLNTKYDVPRVASDFMQSDVKYLTLDNSIKTCLKFMESHGIRHAPVLEKTREDDNKVKLEFVGIVSERDVLRINEPLSKTRGVRKISDKALRRLLSKVFTRNPVTVKPDDPVEVICDYLTNRHVDMLPVLSEEGLAGIITTSDILRFYNSFFTRFNKILVKVKRMPQALKEKIVDDETIEVMEVFSRLSIMDIGSRKLVTLNSKDTIRSAMKVMQEKRIRHIPILSDSGQLMGIISDRDILKNLPYQQGRELLRSDDFRGDLFEAAGDAAELEIKLGEIMEKKVITALPQTCLEEVSKLMRRKKIGCLPVADNNNLLGICSIYDMIRYLPEFYRPVQDVI